MLRVNISLVYRLVVSANFSMDSTLGYRWESIKAICRVLQSQNNIVKYFVLQMHFKI
jgi:hypothetical protein